MPAGLVPSIGFKEESVSLAFFSFQCPCAFLGFCPLPPFSKYITPVSWCNFFCKLISLCFFHLRILGIMLGPFRNSPCQDPYVCFICKSLPCQATFIGSRVILLSSIDSFILAFSFEEFVFQYLLSHIPSNESE